MSIETQCWKFLWSSSPALTKITSGQLFSFDPVVAVLIYSYFRGSRYRGAQLLLHINSAVFPCIPLESDFTQAVALLLSWVCNYIISFPGYTVNVFPNTYSRTTLSRNGTTGRPLGDVYHTRQNLLVSQASHYSLPNIIGLANLDKVLFPKIDVYIA